MKTCREYAEEITSTWLPGGFEAALLDGISIGDMNRINLIHQLPRSMVDGIVESILDICRENVANKKGETPP